MLKSLRSHKVYVPLITVLGSAWLFFLYYVFYVSGQHAYTDERAFRLLGVVSNQLAQRLGNLKDVIAAAYVSPQPDEYLGTYLKSRASNVSSNPALQHS